MQKVLIIRLSAIGDIIMASGLLPAIQRAYPDVQIDWLAQPECRNLLEETSEIKTVLSLSRQKWAQDIKRFRWARVALEMTSLVRTVKQRDYDLVLDIQGLWKSAVPAWLTRSKQRIGLDSREGSHKLMTEIVTCPKGDMRIASEYKTLLEYLGLGADNYRLGIQVSEEDIETARRVRERHHINQEYIVFSPFTTRAQKHWIDSRWLQLADRWENQSRLPVLILGGPFEQSKGATYEVESDGLMINLAGQTTLRQGLALIQGASLVVGVDTGLTHMGVLSNVPTVALFGSTCPYLVTDNPRARVLYEPFSCSPCKRNPTCHGQFHCMQALTVDHVMEAVMEVMAG